LNVLHRAAPINRKQEPRRESSVSSRCLIGSLSAPVGGRWPEPDSKGRRALPESRCTLKLSFPRKRESSKGRKMPIDSCLRRNDSGQFCHTEQSSLTPETTLQRLPESVRALLQIGEGSTLSFPRRRESTGISHLSMDSRLCRSDMSRIVVPEERFHDILSTPAAHPHGGGMPHRERFA
jgi:hypothetical protein